ncbi:TetR/AcrR family transcriptional regulator [Streptosporangium sp. NPDC000396]|uniref:TetR/AcrR family transcriptional regulator n=1 Tax=Streptosporangium sp. NPDC000396 TaxID=3366185 RepID=UPI0036B84143
MRSGSTADPSPRRRGRPPKSEGAATSERLLEAALELFARQGYAATTIRQIAEAVGVRDSAIYAHFSGKQGIYDALFAEAGPPSLDALHIDEEALVAAGPHQAVPNLVKHVFGRWSSRRVRLFAEVLLREGTGADGLGGLARAIEDARDRLEGPFQRWQAAGLVRSDVPARQLVWELFAPLQVPRFVFLRPEATDADIAAAHQWVDDHVSFFLICVTSTGKD